MYQVVPTASLSQTLKSCKYSLFSGEVETELPIQNKRNQRKRCAKKCVLPLLQKIFHDPFDFPKCLAYDFTERPKNRR